MKKSSMELVGIMTWVDDGHECDFQFIRNNEHQIGKGVHSTGYYDGIYMWTYQFEHAHDFRGFPEFDAIRYYDPIHNGDQLESPPPYAIFLREGKEVGRYNWEVHPISIAYIRPNDDSEPPTSSVLDVFMSMED